MTLDARMNAATYPDADHSAAPSPTRNVRPAAPLLACRLLSEPVRISLAGPGAMVLRLSSRGWVADWPTSPRIETSARSAGKIERTPKYVNAAAQIVMSSSRHSWIVRVSTPTRDRVDSFAARPLAPLRFRWLLRLRIAIASVQRRLRSRPNATPPTNAATAAVGTGFSRAAPLIWSTAERPPAELAPLPAVTAASPSAL